MEIASGIHGFVEEHSTHNLAIVHAVADLRIGFAIVDQNLKIDESAERMKMPKGRHETVAQDDSCSMCSHS